MDAMRTDENRSAESPETTQQFEVVYVRGTGKCLIPKDRNDDRQRTIEPNSAMGNRQRAGISVNAG